MVDVTVQRCLIIQIYHKFGRMTIFFQMCATSFSLNYMHALHILVVFFRKALKCINSSELVVFDWGDVNVVILWSLVENAPV